MDWSQMAVFLYISALTHFLSDLSSPLKRRGGIFFLLHGILYAILFIPLFWWMNINLLWLIFVSGSHLLIDSQGKNIHNLTDKIFTKLEEKSLSRPVGLGLDQVFHLLALLIIALYVF